MSETTRNRVRIRDQIRKAGMSSYRAFSMGIGLWAAFPWVVYVTLPLVGVATRENALISITVLLVILDLFVNVVLKRIAKATLPTHMTDRPAVARARAAGKPIKGVYPQGCSPILRPLGFEPRRATETQGMPSGHSAFAAALVTMLLLHRGFKREDADDPLSGWFWAALVLGLAVVAAVATSRVASDCHSPAQVWAGAAAGTGLGAAAYLGLAAASKRFNLERITGVSL